MDDKDLRVVAAAIRSEATGEIFSVPRPGRHHNVIALMGARFSQRDQQGFLLQDGSFVSRRAAMECALRTGQVSRENVYSDRGLFSEDVW